MSCNLLNPQNVCKYVAVFPLLNKACNSDPFMYDFINKNLSFSVVSSVRHEWSSYKIRRMKIFILFSKHQEQRDVSQGRLELAKDNILSKWSTTITDAIWNYVDNILHPNSDKAYIEERPEMDTAPLFLNMGHGLPFELNLQAPVVQRLDNVIHRINHYPADSVVCFVNTYPLDSVIQPLNNRDQVYNEQTRRLHLQRCALWWRHAAHFPRKWRATREKQTGYSHWAEIYVSSLA